jgi:predicted O-methyltransferase YrrM
MSYKAVPMTDALSNYVNEQVTHETPAQKALRAVTQKLPNAQMQIAHDQAAFLTLMIKLTNAKKALEIGTFTGYSALTVAAALPDDGHLTCCDVSEEWTNTAKEHWKRAGLDQKITLILAPAAQTLQKLLDDDQGGTFDFAFIDADKTAYDTYYELVLQLLRPGGMLVLDNMLRGGKVADPNHHDESTDAIRALNQKIATDPRVTSALLTIADGFMCALRNP